MSKEPVTLDHIGIAVSDLARSRAFYETALAPLGLSVVLDLTPDMTGLGETYCGFGRDEPFFWIGTGRRTEGFLHVCFRAPDRATVDRFHAAGLAAGGRDNGAPGPRPHYHPTYYGAFILDPDGHNIEACCHKPE